MRLADLNPRWFAEEWRHGQGVEFDCPCCVGKPKGYRLAVAFSPTLDGGPAIDVKNHLILFRTLQVTKKCVVPPGVVWGRTGDSFETLSIFPSVDCSAAGHWHGFVQDGEIR